MTRSLEPCLCGDPECQRCFPRSPARTVRVVVRMTPEAVADIQRAARIERVTASEYIRRSVEERMVGQEEPGQGEGRR